MKNTRHLFALLALSIALAVAAGCQYLRRQEPEPELYTEATPGPWKNVKIRISFDNSTAVTKITVAVREYPTKPGDYVRRFDLVDGKRNSVGQRVFAYGDEPAETFILDTAAKQVTVTITSTGRGQWRSNPRRVPSME